MPSHDVFVTTEESSIRNVKSVWLILDYSDPACPLTIARAKPNIVRRGKTDFDGNMRTDAVRISVFLPQPVPKFTKADL